MQARGNGTCSPDYLAALDHLPFPLRLCDQSGDTRFFNRAWLVLTGTPAAEQMGSGWIARVHPDDLSGLLATRVPLRRGEAHQVDYRLRDADDEWVWLRESAGPAAGTGTATDTAAGTAAGTATGTGILHLCACQPIGDHRLAEARRLRAEERFDMINTLAHVTTFEMDTRTKQVTWTPEVYDLYGVPPETDMHEAFAIWAALLHPEDREETIARSHAATDGSGTLDFNFRIIHPDRGLRHIELRSRLVRDADGIARIIGVMTDVTDLRTNEIGFREAERRLRDIAENFPGIVYQRTTDPDGRASFAYFSGSDTRLIDIPRNRFAGLLTASHAPGEDAGTDAAAVTQQMIDRIGSIVGSRGEKRWVRSRARAQTRADGTQVLTGFLIDVTDDKLRETELERTATKLRLTMAVAGIGIWELDPHAFKVTGSPLFNAMFGLPGDGAWRDVQDYLDAVDAEERERLLAIPTAEFAMAGPVESEVNVRRADGAWRTLQFSAMRTALSDGTDRIIGVISDVTERRAHEHEREEALRMIQLLLGEMNHRVKNILQVILALLRLLRPSDPQAAAASAAAIRHVEVIGDIYSDFSFLDCQSRIDLGQHLRRVTHRLSAAGWRTRCAAPHCLIDIEQAIPIGIVLNDLLERLTSATDGPDVNTTTITLDLACEDNGPLVVEIGTVPPDRARGGAPDTDAGPDLRMAGPDGRLDMGMQIVAGLCGQIKATLERNPVAGVAYRLTLPSRERLAASRRQSPKHDADPLTLTQRSATGTKPA